MHKWHKLNAATIMCLSEAGSPADLNQLQDNKCTGVPYVSSMETIRIKQWRSPASFTYQYWYSSIQVGDASDVIRPVGLNKHLYFHADNLRLVGRLVIILGK